jgi:hypothetical protein
MCQLIAKMDRLTELASPTAGRSVESLAREFPVHEFNAVFEPRHSKLRRNPKFSVFQFYVPLQQYSLFVGRKIALNRKFFGDGIDVGL